MRSPGGGDNLFLGSIVALRPETGHYVWHFQETPGDSWDYTSTQPIILADVKIGGQVRKALLHAPKNGFFYVLDRATGKFIQGTNYSAVNWATGLDKNGRPIEVPEARYGATGKTFNAIPGPGGAHDWQPMSFSPKTGLVYIPEMEGGFSYKNDPTEGGTGRSKLGFNTGAGAFSADVRPPSAGPAPTAPQQGGAGVTAGNLRGAHLLAWDPVAQKAVFKVPMRKSFNGGAMATAGGLVFAGSAATDFTAYNDMTGDKLWSFDAQTGIIAGPASYELDGVQYVAIMAGWGGTTAPYSTRSDSNGPARLLVFKLGGTDKLPPRPADDRPPLDPPKAGRWHARGGQGRLPVRPLLPALPRRRGGRRRPGRHGAGGSAPLAVHPGPGRLQPGGGKGPAAARRHGAFRRGGGRRPDPRHPRLPSSTKPTRPSWLRPNRVRIGLTLLTASAALAAAGCALAQAPAAPPPPGYAAFGAPPPPGAAPGMTVKEFAPSAGKTYKVSFKAGDEVMSGLARFAAAHPMAQAQISGVGGVSGATLAWYDPKVRAFKLIEVKEKCEISGVTGAISTNAQGKPSVHLHLVLTRSDGSSVSGHLITATIDPILELFVTDLGAGEDVVVP